MDQTACLIFRIPEDYEAFRKQWLNYSGNGPFWILKKNERH